MGSARAFTASLLFIAVVGASAPAGAGGETSRATDPPSITLIEQPPWVALNGSFRLRVRVARIDSESAGGYELRLRVHGALSSRSAFEQTATGTGLGGTLGSLRFGLDELARNSRGDATVPVGLAGSSLDDDLPVRRIGVYPLEVELTERGGAAIDGFVTWLVAVPDTNTPAIPARLLVSWVWPVVADPLDNADGTPDPAVLSELATDGRINHIATLLDRARGVPLSLVVSPETLERWRAATRDDPELVEGYRNVRDAAARDENQLLPAPYVPIDLTALEAAGLGDHLARELVEGSDRLEAATGVNIDPRTSFVDPVDDAVLERLRLSFVDQVAVREQSLEPVERRLTPALPFSIATGDHVVSAAATNPGLESLLDGDAPRALRAQRFLAGVSLVALEAPSRERGIIFAPPERWDPDVKLYSLVVDALRDHPLLEPATLSAYFSRLPDDTAGEGDASLVRMLAPSSPRTHPTSASDYDRARQSLASFTSLVGEDDPRIARGQRALLVALTTSFSRDRAARELDVIETSAEAFLGGISTANKRVTLTARRADIPLTFRNDTDQPVRVRVRLESTKLLFPDGNESTIELPRGRTTERFAVEARTSGTFQMTVTLTSEDGQLPIGPPTRITVRSAVFSGIGVLITVGALLFLAGWWANHIRRARRARAAAADEAS